MVDANLLISTRFGAGQARAHAGVQPRGRCLAVTEEIVVLVGCCRSNCQGDISIAALSCRAAHDSGLEVRQDSVKTGWSLIFATFRGIGRVILLKPATVQAATLELVLRLPAFAMALCESGWRRRAERGGNLCRQTSQSRAGKRLSPPRWWPCARRWSHS